MTIVQMILHYIDQKRGDNGLKLSSHQVQRNIPEWCAEMFNAVHNPDTFSRKFRLIREHAEQYGLSFTTINEKREKTWIIKVNDTSKLQSVLQTGVGA